MSSTLLEQLQARKQSIETDLSKTEKRIYELETNYLMAESSQVGSVLKGFEGFLSSKDNIRKRARTFKIDDRVFSLSSSTSPAAAEVDQQSNDGGGDSGQGSGRGGKFQRQNSRSSLGR